MYVAYLLTGDDPYDHKRVRDNHSKLFTDPAAAAAKVAAWKSVIEKNKESYPWANLLVLSLKTGEITEKYHYFTEPKERMRLNVKTTSLPSTFYTDLPNINLPNNNF